MPIHDWSHAPPGLFHHFHQRWAGAICDVLNDGRLPDGYYALVEQHAVGLVPDVLTLDRAPAANRRSPARGGGGVAVLDSPPKADFVSRATEEATLVARANRIVVRASGSDTIAVMEIVSPGNKSNRHTLDAFVRKTHDFLSREVSVSVVDLFPPSPHNPNGIHGLVWEAVGDEPFRLPPHRPLTLAAYAAGPPVTAYIQAVAVGDVLPEIPVFLDPYTYVPVPLESPYMQMWERCPREFKEDVLRSAPGQP